MRENEQRKMSAETIYKCWKKHQNKCWICNEEKVLTKHHAIPKKFKSRKNVIIPLCNECHRKLNGYLEDVIYCDTDSAIVKRPKT